MAETFTGLPGNYTKTADTLRSFKELCEGKWEHLPEQAFMYVGPIEMAAEKGREAEGRGVGRETRWCGTG